MTNFTQQIRRFRMWFTFRRIFPWAFLMMAFALAVRQCAYLDPDLWWHLQTGQDIIRNGAIPRVDIYSFTKAGSEWVAHEWLSEVVIYLIYRIAGWGGLVTVFSGLITLALFITYRRCPGQPYVAAVAVLLAAASSSPLFGIRPQMFTFLLASIYIAILSGVQYQRNKRHLWILAPLMLVWVNLHAGYALGLVLILLYMVATALDGGWRQLKPLTITLGLCALLVPLNPNGLRIFSYPFETLTSPAMASFIEECASPDFHQVMYLPLAALLFALLGAVALAPERPRHGEVFLLFVTGFGALRSGRHIPIFALIAAPILAKYLWSFMRARSWDWFFFSPPRQVTAFALGLNILFLAAPASLCAVRVWHLVTHQKAYEAKNYPVAAVDYLARMKPAGPIYNRYGWGGYLIRRLYPEYHVYIDGRADVYGDDFMVEAMRTYDGHFGWRAPLERLSINTVLIAPNAPLSSLLREDKEWARIYEDRQAVIFTRRDRVDTEVATRGSTPQNIHSNR